MNRRRNARGAALIEFAISLPFAMILFVGMADFTAYFWRQTALEEASRSALAKITPAASGYLKADAEALTRYASSIQTTVRQESGIESLTVALSHRYSCPSGNGAESNLAESPQHCEGERVYLRVASEQAVSPMLTPLQLAGYPTAVVSRHYLRLQ